MSDGDKLAAWLREGAHEIENAHRVLDDRGVARVNPETGNEMTLAARIALWPAAQQQGNERNERNETERRADGPMTTTAAEREQRAFDAAYPPEQADERCPKCGGRGRVTRSRILEDRPRGMGGGNMWNEDCPDCSGTGKKPTQDGNPDLGYGGVRPLLPPRTTQTALRHAIQDRDKALARALAAERERDELRRAAQMAQGQAEHFRQLDEANYQLRVKYRKAIERHRDSGTASPQYDHNRELWAVLEGESE